MQNLDQILKPENLLPLVLMVVALLSLRWLPRLLSGAAFKPPAALHAALAADAETVVIDVRSEAEFTSSLGHVPGSLNVPLNDLASRLMNNRDSLSAYQGNTVWVVCRSGQRATTAARLLKRYGLSAIVLDGGMLKWKSAGLAVEQ